jgi:hypothetical protein
MVHATWEMGSAYLGNGLAVKTHYNASKLLIAMFNVEVDLMGDLGTCISLSVLCIACACFMASAHLWWPPSSAQRRQR